MSAFQPITDRVRELRPDLVPRRAFLLLAPFLYAAYALLTPAFQNFDENQHLYRAWQISTSQLVGERRGARSGGELPPGLARATVQEIGSITPQTARRTVRRPVSQMFGWNTPIGTAEKPIYYDFFGAVVYAPVGYLPQILAVRIGVAAGLSVEWTLRLGRLSNVALCLGLVLWALKLIPYGRWPMAIIALSPPMAAAAASFGQDALVGGSGFLLTALGLRIAAERRWTGARATTVGLATLAVSLAKFVYLPLVAVAVFPLPRAVSLRRWFTPPLLIGAAAAFLVYAWIRINAPALVPSFRPWVPTMPEQVSWAAAHPLEFTALIGRTFLFELPTLWARFYTFGDSTVPTIWAAAIPGTAALLVAMAYGERNALDLTRGRRLWILLTFGAVALLIAFAMFLTLAARGAIVIEGIQARYFLPVLPLGAIGLMRRGEDAPRGVMTVTIALVLAAHAATLGTIAATFYSV